METTIHELVMDKPDRGISFSEATETLDPLDYQMSQLFGDNNNCPGYDLQNAFAGQGPSSENNEGKKTLQSWKEICIDKLEQLNKENKAMSSGLSQIVDKMQHFIETNKKREDEMEYLIGTFSKN